MKRNNTHDPKGTAVRAALVLVLLASAGIARFLSSRAITVPDETPFSDVHKDDDVHHFDSSPEEKEAKAFLSAIDISGILAVLQTDEAEVNRKLETRTMLSRVPSIFASLGRPEKLPREESARIKTALASRWAPSCRHVYFGKSELFVHRDRFTPSMIWDTDGNAVHHSPDPTLASLAGEKKGEIGRLHGDWRVLRDKELYLAATSTNSELGKKNGHHPCLIYSFGVHREWQFDDFTSTVLKCETHSFDPMVSDGRDSGLDYRALHEGHAAKHNIPNLHFHFMGLHGDSPAPRSGESSASSGSFGSPHATFDGSAVDANVMQTLPQVRMIE